MLHKVVQNNNTGICCVLFVSPPTVLISTVNCQLIMLRTSISTNKLVLFSRDNVLSVCTWIQVYFLYCVYTCRPSVTFGLVNCFKNTPVKLGSLSCKLIASHGVYCVYSVDVPSIKYPPPSKLGLQYCRPPI